MAWYFLSSVYHPVLTFTNSCLLYLLPTCLSENSMLLILDNMSDLGFYPLQDCSVLFPVILFRNFFHCMICKSILSTSFCHTQISKVEYLLSAYSLVVYSLSPYKIRSTHSISPVILLFPDSYSHNDTLFLLLIQSLHFRFPFYLTSSFLWVMYTIP